METLSENYNKLKGSFLSGQFGGGSSISLRNAKNVKSPSRHNRSRSRNKGYSVMSAKSNNSATSWLSSLSFNNQTQTEPDVCKKEVPVAKISLVFK